MPGPIDRPSSSPNVRWKRLGIFGGVTLSAWIAAWFWMNQVVADIFIVQKEQSSFHGKISLKQTSVKRPQKR